MIEQITQEDYELALKYYNMSKTDDFKAMISDLESHILRSRAKVCRIRESEKLFLSTWTINGFDNCRAYILTKINIVNDVKSGKIKIIGETNE